jgi:hypothetical protein
MEGVMEVGEPVMNVHDRLKNVPEAVMEFDDRGHGRP